MKDRKKEKEGKISYIFTRETFGVTLLLFSLVVLLMLFSYNAIFAGIGAAVCTFMYGTFGYGSFLIIALLAYFGVWLAFEKKTENFFQEDGSYLCVGICAVFALSCGFHALVSDWRLR